MRCLRHQKNINQGKFFCIFKSKHMICGPIVPWLFFRSSSQRGSKNTIMQILGKRVLLFSSRYFGIWRRKINVCACNPQSPAPISHKFEKKKKQANLFSSIAKRIRKGMRMRAMFFCSAANKKKRKLNPSSSFASRQIL